MIRGAQCHIELGFLRAQPASLPLLIPTAEHRDAVFRLVARQRGRLGQDLGQPVEREIKRLLVPALGTWQRPWHELAGHTGGQTVLGQAALLSRLLAGENARRDRAVAVHQSAFGVLRFRPFRKASRFSMLLTSSAGAVLTGGRLRFHRASKFSIGPAPSPSSGA